MSDLRHPPLLGIGATFSDGSELYRRQRVALEAAANAARATGPGPIVRDEDVEAAIGAYLRSMRESAGTEVPR